ncbi:MAG: SRPBCC family protein [Chloroflexota bacterium]
MADILHLVPIQASPQSVYEAITTEEGLKSWWTDDVSAEPREGSMAVFRFEGGQVAFRMNVDKLEPVQAVEWSVEAPAPPEWEETRVTWHLQPDNGGNTHLLFGHRDWASTENSFAAINYNWAYYLTSLKEYLEKGQGFPHRNDA